MSYTPAKVTIDLEEYNDLLKIKEEKKEYGVLTDFIFSLAKMNPKHIGNLIDTYNKDREGLYRIVVNNTTSGYSLQIVKK